MASLVSSALLHGLGSLTTFALATHKGKNNAQIVFIIINKSSFVVKNILEVVGLLCSKKFRLYLPTRHLFKQHKEELNAPKKVN